MQPKVAVSGILRFPPGRLAEVRPRLRALIQSAYRDDGLDSRSCGWITA
jgi:hypothetical protein